MHHRAESAADVRDGMIIVRTLEAVVKNKDANDPGELACWASESQVEKTPGKKQNHLLPHPRRNAPG